MSISRKISKSLIHDTNVAIFTGRRILLIQKGINRISCRDFSGRKLPVSAGVPATGIATAPVPATGITPVAGTGTGFAPIAGGAVGGSAAPAVTVVLPIVVMAAAHHAADHHAREQATHAAAGLAVPALLHGNRPL